jgi:hypothetical protein
VEVADTVRSFKEVLDGKHDDLPEQAFYMVGSIEEDADIARRITRLLSILLGIGLLAGLAGYGLKQGHLMGGHFNGVIGLKFVILLMVGGLLPLTRKEGRGDRVRWILLALLAFAVLSALTLRHV